MSQVFAYTKSADMWAVGVIMYELITGRHPVRDFGENKMEMEEKMKTFKKFSFPKSMSKQAQHLIA